MAGVTDDVPTCPGCGSAYTNPAIGATGESVCPTCGAPLGRGPSPDDTAAFQRFYAAPAVVPERPRGLRGWLDRLRRR